MRKFKMKNQFKHITKTRKNIDATNESWIMIKMS